ncbi:MAG: hypothetical protein DRH30_07930 [Deltaproteobacteria bacterium]|nr:MAG: hypothetical protein DRH30_07930 [Deltaproteobacteria bacterium]
MNTWLSQTYYTQEVVRDGDWTMVANKETTDRAAPQPTGGLAWTVPDVPAWSVLQFTGPVSSGLRIQNITDLWSILRVRVWVQGITASDHYRVVTVDNITGERTIGQEFDGTIVDAPGWLTLATSFSLVPGADVVIYLLHENSAGTTDFNHPWAVVGSSNQDNDPGLGNIDWDNQITRIRLNEEDDDGADRSSELASVTLNSIIRVVDEDDLNSYYEFEVIGITDMIGWWQYATVLLNTGSGGPPPLGRSQVYFQIPVATPADYVVLPGNYTGVPSLTGLLQLGNGAATEDDKSYGTDVEAQRYIASPDWDLLALFGGGSSSSGSGGSSELFTDLLDTPSAYGGNAYQPVKVKSDITGLMFGTTFEPTTDVDGPLSLLDAHDGAILHCTGVSDLTLQMESIVADNWTAMVVNDLDAKEVIITNATNDTYRVIYNGTVFLVSNFSTAVRIPVSTTMLLTKITALTFALTGNS